MQFTRPVLKPIMAICIYVSNRTTLALLRNKQKTPVANYRHRSSLGHASNSSNTEGYDSEENDSEDGESDDTYSDEEK